MKAFTLIILALAASVLSACSVGGVGDEPVTAMPAAAENTAAITPGTTVPPAAAAESAASPATAAAAAPREATVHGRHIDAPAFLNALVESGCQIDKAEYKEVKRGGAIKVVCSRTQDPLSVDLDDL